MRCEEHRHPPVKAEPQCQDSRWSVDSGIWNSWGFVHELCDQIQQMSLSLFFGIRNSALLTMNPRDVRMSWVPAKNVLGSSDVLSKYWSSVVLLYEGRGRRQLVLGTWVPSEGTSCVSAPGPHVTFSVRPSLTIPMNSSSPPHPAWSPAFSFLLDSSLLNVLYSVCSTLCFTCLLAILSFPVSSRRRGMIVLSTDIFLMLVTVGGTYSVFYL